MKNRITVFIPTFNRAELLREALTCLRLQSLSKDCFRVVIADNASEDHTSDVIGDFNDLDIVYLKRKTNIGIYKNWLSVKEFCDTEYVHFLSDDDLLSPSHLWYAFNEMEKHDEVGVFGSGSLYGANFWGEDVRLTGLLLGDSFIDKTDQCCHWSREAWLAAHSVASAVTFNGCLFRTSVLQKIVPLFDPDIPLMGDRWFMAQIGVLTDCVTSPWPTCSLRVVGDNCAHGRPVEDLYEESRLVAGRTVDLAIRHGYDLVGFWKNYFNTDGRNRSEIKHSIYKYYPTKEANEILAGWKPYEGRIDRLPIPKSAKKGIRALKDSLAGK